MLQEIPRLGMPKTEKISRRMEYHTEQIVTIKMHFSVHLAIVAAGIFFVLSAYFSS